MSLNGVLVRQVTIKLDADMFYDLFRNKPHHTTKMSHFVKSVDLLDGEWGAHGSIVMWNFIHDGKEKMFKDMIVVDEDKRLVCLKVLEGDVLEDYKSFSFTAHVDTKGEEILVTWTIHYEKLGESVNDPESFMDLCINFTKDIENHHLSKSN